MNDDWRNLETREHYFKPVVRLSQTDYDRWIELAHERRKRHNAFDWMFGASTVLSVTLFALIATWLYPIFRSVFEPCDGLVSRLGLLLFLGVLLLGIFALIKIDEKYLRPILTRWINRHHRSIADINRDTKAIFTRYGITDTLDVYVELKP